MWSFFLKGNHDCWMGQEGEYNIHHIKINSVHRLALVYLFIIKLTIQKHLAMMLNYVMK